MPYPDQAVFYPCDSCRPRRSTLLLRVEPGGAGEAEAEAEARVVAAAVMTLGTSAG